MRNRNKFKIKRTDLALVAIVRNIENRVNVMLFALGFHKRHSQLRTVKRDVRAHPQQIRHASDMILMTVRENHSVNLIQTVFNI